MKAYVYVLWSAKLEKRYIGSCRSLEKRLEAHNKGRQRFTKGGVPWVLIYKEEYEDYSAARRREIFLKSGQGRKFLSNVT